jgi:dienelactone hydrolase
VGFSIGGFGALRYALAYPQTFAAATLLSPALQQGQPPATAGAIERGSFGAPYDPERWDELNYPALLEPYAAQEHRVPIFIVTGDDDWNHLSEKEALPADATKYNMEVQAVALYTALHRETSSTPNTNSGKRSQPARPNCAFSTAVTTWTFGGRGSLKVSPTCSATGSPHQKAP